MRGRLTGTASLRPEPSARIRGLFTKAAGLCPASACLEAAGRKRRVCGAAVRSASSDALPCPDLPRLLPCRREKQPVQKTDFLTGILRAVCLPAGPEAPVGLSGGLLRCAGSQLSRLVLMTYSVSATVSAMPTAAREITMTIRFFRTNARNPEAGWTGWV